MTLESLRSSAERCVAGARMPGLVLAVARGSEPPAVVALGQDAAGHTLAEDSLFILASITKLATALALLRLAATGKAQLDDELADYLPHAASAQPGVTLRRVMSHSAGLPVDVNPANAPYQAGLTWAELAAACLLEPLQAEPYSVVQYGNMAYGLLSLVIEQLSGRAFSVALQELVLEPLGIEGYLSSEVPRHVAILSDVRSQAPKELETFNSDFYRSLALPWAGLITTAAGALRLVQAFAGLAGDFLPADLLADARRSQTSGLHGGSTPPLWWPDCPWGAGPELRGTKQPHWSPENAAPESFGHAGASGCIAWHDPASQVSYSLMGTRTAANGWLLRHGSLLGASLMEQLRDS